MVDNIQTNSGLAGFFDKLPIGDDGLTDKIIVTAVGTAVTVVTKKVVDEAYQRLVVEPKKNRTAQLALVENLNPTTDSPEEG